MNHPEVLHKCKESKVAPVSILRGGEMRYEMEELGLV
jgi:hypothetical protein